jgi:hypothetical protein
MSFRQFSLSLAILAGAACTHSSAPRQNGAELGYSLSTYGSNSYVPPLIASDGHSIVGLNGNLLLSGNGTATATFRYRLDSNSNPEKTKTFSGTWIQGASGRTIEINGVTTSESTTYGISRATMTASWTDSGVLIGGVFGFIQVFPE